ncbi:MAG: LysR family transcriptional regulator [Clostridia bacterium]|nr:LysR family transcriptional regulator [Clostridia bacterium]
MNSRQMQYAVELAKDRNFSQTAERLGITQPALSKHILGLEKELGVKLFDRSTNPMSLTAAGEHFIRQSQELLYREDQMLRSLEAYKSGESGRLAIGISPFRSLYMISDVVRQVREAYPDVQVVLHEPTSDLMRTEAAEGKYDFAIVNLPVDEAVLDVIPLEADVMVLAVPAAMAAELPQTDVLDLAACAHLPFVTVEPSLEMRRQFDAACTAAQFRPQIAAQAGGLSSAWALCRAGVGATLLPRQFVCHNEEGKDVVLYALKQPMQTRQPVIVTRRGQYLSPYAEYAIRLLTEQKG